jgi:transposase-like protein
MAKGLATGQPEAEVQEISLDEVIRGRIRGEIEELLIEELEATLGALRHERSEARQGYRNGVRPRTLTCQTGTFTLEMPRARLFAEDGSSREYRSRFVPYYQRRTKAVDEALLGAYVCGTSTRKVKRALSPLWKKGPLSKSTVSRLVPRLKARLEDFEECDLSGRRFVYLYLDAIALRVRLARKVTSVPVMVAVGVDPAGRKELVSLSLWSSESREAWGGFCTALRDRGVAGLRLVMIDGSKALRTAVETTWPEADVQRCVVHSVPSRGARFVGRRAA